MSPVTIHPVARAESDRTWIEASVAASSPGFEPSESDLRDARRYLPQGSAEEQFAFAQRQLRARARATQLLDFYRRYPCHLADLHLLAACAVALGRFRGFSPEFDEMGEEFMLAGDDGRPRTREWQVYVEACDDGRPWQVRDELWIAAHMEDTERVRRSGLEERFRRQAAAHADDPTWQERRRNGEPRRHP